MNVRVINLGSSSQGNCTLYEYGPHRVLVDAGLSAKQIELRLMEVSVSLESISAILLTHEHDDHCGAIKQLRKKLPNARIYANHATSKAIGPVVSYEIFRSGGYFWPVPGEKTLIVGSIRVPHTAAEPVGFSLYLGDTKCVHLTDLGHVSDEIVSEHLVDADIILIESNYDPQLLAEREGLRPFETHKRNFGRTGHLSNEECGAALLRVKNLYLDLYSTDVWSPRICLLHLSRQFNTPELALGTVSRLTGREGILVSQGDQVTTVFEGALENA